MYKRYLFALLYAFIATVSLPYSAMAAKNNREAYEKNDISFYDENFVMCSPSSTNGVSGSSNQEKVWGFLKASGLSDEQAAGVMGNIRQESGFSPNVQNTTAKFPSGAWGLAQWTDGRRQSVVKAIQEKHPEVMSYYAEQYGGLPDQNGVSPGVPVDVNDKFLIVELEFLIQESKARGLDAVGISEYIDKYGAGDSEWETLKRITDVTDAVFFWERSFERSGNSHGSVMEQRVKPAMEFYEKFKGTGGSGTTSSPATPKVTFIGDSITEGMRSNLMSTFPGSNVEAKVGEGIQWVISKLDTATLNDTVVINIGTNDNFPVDKAKEMLNKLKGKKVYLVNNFGKGGSANFEIINGGITSVASEYTNVTIIDWKKVAESNGGREALYKPDGYHINDDKGRELYIKLLKDSLGSATTSTGGACESAAPTGDVQAMIKKYAWPNYRPGNMERKPEYIDAVERHKVDKTDSDGNVILKGYVGNHCHGGGIDCGGFVTILMRDTIDKNYNTNPTGNTVSQRAYLEREWQKIGTGSTINTSDLRPGDVAMLPGHTFTYAGEMEGFQGVTAGASECDYAPMASQESVTNPTITWYRKK